jgi:hypothetical protein
MGRRKEIDDTKCCYCGKNYRSNEETVEWGPPGERKSSHQKCLFANSGMTHIGSRTRVI